MAADLEGNRKMLQEANLRLEERRLHMETILESIPSGVLSLDGSGQVTRVNAALIRMFQPVAVTQPGAQNGLRLNDIFPTERAPGVAEELWRLARKAERMGITGSQIEIPAGHGALEVGITAASMTGAGSRRRLGCVLVFEDLSELLQAQTQAAWSEVARRVAHEIKNPLTPISLSAERIKRHVARIGGDSASLAVIESCAEIIGGSVETVRRLADEFSALARFPNSQPRFCDLNQIVEAALAMFAGRLNEVQLNIELDGKLPQVMADPEAMKRVVANLIDNAAESMQDSLVRELHIATTLLETRDMVEIEISDSGCGVTPESKEKLFQPYFSTKGRGSGLGLAIVARIVDEHRGAIRVEENKPVGTRFLIELPVAAETAGGEA
jgi:nitrogen fixation/metabolism regulation signal transduction histidine kinase